MESRQVAVDREWFEKRLGYESITTRMLRTIHKMSERVKRLPIGMKDEGAVVCHQHHEFFLPSAVLFKCTRQ